MRRAPDRRPARDRRRARHRHRHHRHARRRPPRTSPTGWSRPACPRSSTSRPTVISVPDEVSLRKVDLAVELQILSFYQQRQAGGPPRCDGRQRRLGRPCRSTSPAVPGEPAASRATGCLVVGGGAVAAEKVQGLLAARRRRARGGARGGRRACARSTGHLGGARPTSRARSPATAWPSPAPTTRRSTRPCSTTARRPACGSTPPTTRPTAPSPSRPGSTGAGCSSRCRPAGTARPWPSWLRDQLADELGPEYDTLARPARRGPGRRCVAGRSPDLGADWRRPSIRGCWTSSGPVASTRPGSASRPPSPPPIRPSRVPR